ncbi:RnfH family protein [Ramlibacter sp.]|uniref:RnfH family protein n=1 Tax=Ramlibacter sp. TaxID=1917967 RepID=UPI002CE0CD5F|nr:RnfH family protein [Ramlibacter sp.]HWI83174.1 RnfH family protein [Ramlibacter sp.]
MRVTVLYSPAPREAMEWTLDLPAGATVRQAIEASGLAQARPAFDWGAAGAGIWGRRADADQRLRDGDRVEVYRPLAVDPKVARRERFRRQGARSAGLFARRQGRGPGG